MRIDSSAPAALAALPPISAAQVRSAPSVSTFPVDTLVLRNSFVAAAELDFLRQWTAGPVRAASAAEYNSAQILAKSGEQAASLVHLERAILGDAAHAAAAERDPAFSGVRGAVHEMVNRLTVVARLGAVSAIALADSDAASPREQTYLRLAESCFAVNSYAGYVEANQAAAAAVRLAALRRAGKSDPRPARAPAALLPARDAFADLRRRAPLLALLLSWLAAGIAAGIVMAPFHIEVVTVIRQLLFPVWAMGLLSMVSFGFIRSLVKARP